MSYSLSSTAHLAILPDWLGLCRMFRRGRVVITAMECDGKYGWSFLAAVTIAKARFSRVGYHDSASSSVLLT